MAFATNAPVDAVSDETLRELFKQFDPLLNRAARRASYYVNGSVNAAEDMAQDVRCHMVVALRNEQCFDRSFVRRIITNALRDRIRFEKRRLQLGSFKSCELNERFAERREELPDAVVALSVSKWLSSLPARLRTVFEALYRQGYSQYEASMALNISQPRVSQLNRELLDRGRQALATLAA